MSAVARPRFAPRPSSTVFSPVSPVSSLLAHQCLSRMRSRERRTRNLNRLRALAGIAIVSLLLAVLPRLIIKAAHFFDALPPDDPQLALATWQFIAIDAGLLLLTFPVALASHRDSRNDSIYQFMDDSAHFRTQSADDLALRVVLTLGCLGLFPGEFLLIDAAKDAALRFRLRRVDRERAALILAALHTNPAGLDPRLLLQHRERPEDFRNVIAYLLTYHWADLSPNADHLTLLSPARRALKA